MTETSTEISAPQASSPANDRTKVRLHQTSGKMLYIEDKIMSTRATPEQVIEWAYAQDPLSEDFVRGLTSVEEGLKIPEKYLKKAGLDELGAWIILSKSGDVISPFQGDSGVYDVTYGFSEDKIERLYLSASLLLEAGARLDAANSYLPTMSEIVDFPLGQHPELADSVKSKVKSAQDYCRRVLSMPEWTNVEKRKQRNAEIGLNIMEKLADGLSYAQPLKPETIQILLKALWTRANYAFSADGLTAKDRKTILKKMINGIDYAFLEKHGILADPNVAKSSKKGILFEFLWTLDAQMLLAITGDNDTRVVPANSFFDAPKVGKPELKRGVDVIIRNTKKGFEYVVQLKSSGQQDPLRYHPLINVVSEQNFQDTNPGRLHLKLEAYRKFLESGFGEKEGQEALKYILPSVKKTFSGERQPKDYHSYSREHFGMVPLGLFQHINLQTLLTED